MNNETTSEIMSFEDYETEDCQANCEDCDCQGQPVQPDDILSMIRQRQAGIEPEPIKPSDGQFRTPPDDMIAMIRERARALDEVASAEETSHKLEEIRKLLSE